MDDRSHDAQAWIDSLPEPRRSQIARLHDLVIRAMPDADVVLKEYSGTMIAYGTYEYSNSKGPAGRWFTVGLANRKAYISLYAMGIVDGRYLVESRIDRFPGARSGRSCLNITHPELIEDDAILELARDSWAQFRGRP